MSGFVRVPEAAAAVCQDLLEEGAVLNLCRLADSYRWADFACSDSFLMARWHQSKRWVRGLMKRLIDIGVVEVVHPGSITETRRIKVVHNYDRPEHGTDHKPDHKRGSNTNQQPDQRRQRQAAADRTTTEPQTGPQVGGVAGPHVETQVPDSDSQSQNQTQKKKAAPKAPPSPSGPEVRASDAFGAAFTATYGESYPWYFGPSGRMGDFKRRAEWASLAGLKAEPGPADERFALACRLYCQAAFAGTTWPKGPATTERFTKTLGEWLTTAGQQMRNPTQPGLSLVPRQDPVEAFITDFCNLPVRRSAFPLTPDPSNPETTRRIAAIVAVGWARWCDRPADNDFARTSYLNELRVAYRRIAA